MAEVARAKTRSNLSRLYGAPLDDFIQDGETDAGMEEPASVPASLEPVPVNAGPASRWALPFYWRRGGNTIKKQTGVRSCIAPKPVV